MDKMIYLAAQYLAAAGKSFLKPRDDDSHTNVGLEETERSIVSRNFNDEGDRLALSFSDFSLNWYTSEGTQKKVLHSVSHGEVKTWLNELSIARLKKPFHFDLHYDIGTELDDSFRYELSDMDRMKALFDLRMMAEKALTEFLNRRSLHSEIRIWPHHFDTGAFVSELKSGSLSLGMGMAVPDSMIDDHYYYFSGYIGNEGVDTSSFEKLFKGSWYNDGFKGAVLPVSNAEPKDIAKFLDEAFDQYML